MGLFERLTKKRLTPTTASSASPTPEVSSGALQPIAPVLQTTQIPATTGFAWGAKKTGGVTQSRDLARILELPRRKRPSAEELQELSKKWTAKLGRGTVSCNCASYKRACPTPLLPVQAWALEEMSLYGGACDPIGVGDGKTLLDLLAALVVPNTRTAVLLVLASLREQLLEVDWDFYGQHWHLPNRAGGRWLLPNMPVVHVLAYSELSGAANTDRLSKIAPDLIIADEAQALRNTTSARGKRFGRHMSGDNPPRLCAWSGTLTSKSLCDYAALAAGALGENSPTPLHYPVVKEWAGALDPVPLGQMPTPAGELMRFCEPGETVNEGWRRRLTETPGVVSSPEDGNYKGALYIRERKVVMPKAVQDAYDKFAAGWERDDGERVVLGLEAARYLRQLASGLYTRWRWPRQEALPVRNRWIAARKLWHSEQREKLKHSREFMDSPLLLTKAAIRWYEGYTHIYRDEAGKETHREEIPPKTKKGPQPTWESYAWPEWKEVRDSALPETEAVWIDDFLARDAAAWANGGIGIVWYEHVAFGAKVAELGGLPQFGPGEEASRLILGERGERSIVASIKSHGTGKNLQPFNRNLIANPPSAGDVWEQLLGRTHRTGQLADEISVEIYRHAPAMIEALDKATILAGHIQGTFGGRQKLLRASRLF